MSDQLSAAAEKLGVPEPLIERSARARATATGQSYEDVIAAWAGGKAVASAAPTEEPAPEPAGDAETPETETPEEVAPAAAPAAAPTEAPTPEPTPAPRIRPSRPPILDAPPDRPLVPVAGGVAVVAAMLLLGFVFPSLPAASNEVRSSRVPYTAEAIDGRHVYQRAGCASCHTQSVRSVVADVGVGPVTMDDTNQVIGFRRVGPDLSDVGTRLTPNQIAAAVTGPSHPALPLSDAAVSALVAYLSESAVSPPTTAGPSTTVAGGSDPTTTVAGS